MRKCRIAGRLSSEEGKEGDRDRQRDTQTEKLYILTHSRVSIWQLLISASAANYRGGLTTYVAKRKSLDMTCTTALKQETEVHRKESGGGRCGSGGWGGGRGGERKVSRQVVIVHASSKPLPSPTSAPWKFVGKFARHVMYAHLERRERKRKKITK